MGRPSRGKYESSASSDDPGAKLVDMSQGQKISKINEWSLSARATRALTALSYVIPFVLL
jgi:hypothetical protein